MPFLRFTRDKRGYETTLLVHPFRRQGRSRQRILYWFRTPPGVKVGRSAFDEDSMRAIEEQNPDIEFNWQKILEAQVSQPPPSAEDAGNRRGRREKISREARRHTGPAVESTDEPELEDAAPVSDVETDEMADVEPVEDEQSAPPESSTVAEQEAPADQLTRLRARYAELQARIAERGGAPDRVEALQAEAELLNPDTWVTDEQVKLGVDEFEGRLQELRSALGLGRRRRSRRGGRRRRPGMDGNGPASEKSDG